MFLVCTIISRLRIVGNQEGFYTADLKEAKALLDELT
jgi:hypothetical protein